MKAIDKNSRLYKLLIQLYVEKGGVEENVTKIVSGSVSVGDGFSSLTTSGSIVYCIIVKDEKKRGFFSTKPERCYPYFTMVDGEKLSTTFNTGHLVEKIISLLDTNF